jgi:hypothetical protein
VNFKFILLKEKELHWNENILISWIFQNYNIQVTDMNQPLLVSRPKKKDIRMGRTEPIYLLPELCTLTGKALHGTHLSLARAVYPDR